MLAGIVIGAAAATVLIMAGCVWFAVVQIRAWKAEDKNYTPRS